MTSGGKGTDKPSGQARKSGGLGPHGGFLVLVAIVATLFVNFSIGLTIDGSGTNSVSPLAVNAASTGNTLSFTFTGAETMDSGEVRIKVPNSSGWSTPQGTVGTAGYTTVAASGNATIANVLSTADSATGWTEDDGDACNTTPPTNGWGLDTGTFHEGTGSITCNNTGDARPDATDSFGYDFSSQNWSSYTQVGFWIRSDVATAAGDVQAAIDNNNNCSSPIEEVNVPALSANSWTYVKWTFALAGSTRTGVTTFCFNAGTNAGMDGKRIWVDDLLVGPGSRTFVANGPDTDIAVRLLDLAAGETLIATYGSGGGTSGATAPSAAGTYAFTTRTRVSDAGSLTEISSSPTVTVNNPVPTTTSISPSSKTVGDAGFTITVNGTNFVSGSTVRWNGSNRTTTFVNSTQLTATIPASDLTGAGTFPVTVINASPGGGTSNAQTFTVNNPVPTTTSISPSSKTVGDAGFTITVNGTNFVSGSTVRWNGSDRTTTFVNSTQLTATIPASDLTTVGTYSVTVFNTTPGGGTSNAQTFTVGNPVPTTTSISPSSKTVGDPGFTITVNGTNFVSGSTVRWNGSDRTTTFVNSTQLTATILASDLTTVGTFSVTVFNPTPGGGTSNAQTFTVTSVPSNPVPTTTSISPSSKVAGDAGFTITVNGTNFISSSVVKWDGSNRTTTFVNSTQLTATIPATDIDTAGAFTVTVFNPTPGGGTSNGQTFTVSSAPNPAPTTTSISPSSKVAGDAGFTITVNGTNFISSSVVKWDGANRTTTFVNSTQLTATIPATDIDTAGAFTVTVFNPTPGGGTSNGQTLTVSSAPTVAVEFFILNPSDTTVGTPTTVTVQARKADDSVDTAYQSDVTLVASGSATGAGLVDIVNGVGTVSLNDSVAETVGLSLSDTQGTGLDVTSVQDVVFSAAPNPVPSTTGVVPSAKYVGDGQFLLTVNGSDFVPSSVVRWGGADLATSYVAASQLTATVPASNLTSAGTFTVTVFSPTPGGGTSNGQTFTVSAAPGLPLEEDLAARTIFSVIQFAGRAFPAAKISLAARQGLEEVTTLQETVAGSDGSFDISNSGLYSGRSTYGLLVADPAGRNAQSRFYNLDLNLGSLTQLDILVPPTVGLVRDTVRKGDLLGVVGFATPGSAITAQIDAQLQPQRATAGDDGAYRLLLGTYDFGYGRHTVRVRQTDSAQKFSDFSLTKIFTVSSLFVTNTDLNGDGIINITDWSIFLSRWGSRDSSLRFQIDFNKDGKVDLSDFSIFIRTVRTK